MKKGLLSILFFVFSSPFLFAQVNIAGGCFTTPTELSSVGNVNGRPAFQGFGEVGGMSGLQINVYWDGSAWFVLVSGQQMLISTMNTTSPPDDAIGGWVSTGAAPCNANFGDITIDGNGTLPVELASFEAYVKERTIDLKWLTLSETNNRGFEVQRSIDGINWLVLGFVSGKGNTTNATRYNYSDPSPQNGTMYYRLKQFDFDGYFEYSDAISVERRVPEKAVSITGNLIKTGLLQLSFDFGQIDLRLVGQLGETILEYNGFSGKFLDISSLGTGVYYLNYRAGNEVNTIRFLKL